MRDTTLDTFCTEADRVDLEGDAASKTDTDADGKRDVDGDVGGEAETSTPVEPAVPAAAWTPGGAPCATCNVVVEWCWRDAGQLVCEDCKEW